MAFAQVELLPYPLNSASDDLGIVFEGMDNSGIFSSNRKGGKGKDDLYSFRMPPMEFSYIAYVYDDETTMIPITEAVITIESSDGEFNTYTTDIDGMVELSDGQLGEGISYEGDLIDLAVEAEIIKKMGSWYSYNDEKIGQGRENAKQYVKENNKFAKKLEKEVKAFLGI